MPILPGYHHFDGRDRETGPVRNALAYQGITAPHTGQPYSEALLLGISGGITFGYFTFEYAGYDPHLALLTRNTFSPFETLLDRLAVPHDVLQTASADKAWDNLITMLEDGLPAIIWADAFSLPYNLLPWDDRNWAVFPLLVYGADGDTVFLADRASMRLAVIRDAFMAARGRVRADRYRLMTLGVPDADKLPSAVQKGIWQCVSLFVDAPPRGARENFGFAALRFWADMLTNTRNRRSWERFFPPGSRMYAALAGDLVQAGAFGWLCGADGACEAERGLYAAFLDEAAIILNRPALADSAALFRQSAAAWKALAADLLPDDVPLLAEARTLKLRRRGLFIEHGDSRLDDIRAVDTRLMELRAEAGRTFPLSAAEASALRARWAGQVIAILDIEQRAVMALQAALS